MGFHQCCLWTAPAIPYVISIMRAQRRYLRMTRNLVVAYLYNPYETQRLYQRVGCRSCGSGTSASIFSGCIDDWCCGCWIELYTLYVLVERGSRARFGAMLHRHSHE